MKILYTLVDISKFILGFQKWWNIFFVDIIFQDEVRPSSAANVDDWRCIKMYSYFDVVYGRTYVLRLRCINILILVKVWCIFQVLFPKRFQIIKQCNSIQNHCNSIQK